MTFIRTHDMDIVRQVMTHPKVYPWISDDGCPTAEEFRPVDIEPLWYVLCCDGADLLGLWLFSPQNSVTYEVHTCLVPGHGFRRAREAGKAVLRWMWKNSGAQRIVTNVPAFNRIALRYAQDGGLVQFGVNRESFLKDGILYDQILLGISRPKEAQCQQSHS